MASFSLQDVLQATGGTVACGKRSEQHFSDVSTDTRTIAPQSLFVALKGETFDGHAFVAAAAEAGASGAVVSEWRDAYRTLPLTVIVVTDTLQAYQDLARFHRRRFSIPVIAVTGSVGKTSTRNMIATVLSQKLQVLQTEKNFNNEIGLPRTLLQLTDRHEACVVEMGMRGLGQIAALAAIAEPTIGVVTNVGICHIELLGSQDNIARAKGELVEAIPANGTAVLNGDDPYVSAMADKCRGAVVTYGEQAQADVQASRISADERGVSFTCQAGGESFDVTVPVIGRHHVYNALAAVAVARLAGLTTEQIQKGLASYAGMPMREELIHIGDCTFINDTYNANPASMAAAVQTLAHLTKGRKIAFLAGMGELGQWAKKAHEDIGRLVVKEHIDILITLGTLAESIASAARSEGMTAVYTTETHAEGAALLQSLLKPGDTVLLKGSRSFAMEKILPYMERKSCEC